MKLTILATHRHHTGNGRWPAPLLRAFFFIYELGDNSERPPRKFVEEKRIFYQFQIRIAVLSKDNKALDIWAGRLLSLEDHQQRNPNGGIMDSREYAAALKINAVALARQKT